MDIGDIISGERNKIKRTGLKKKFLFWGQRRQRRAGVNGSGIQRTQL